MEKRTPHCRLSIVKGMIQAGKVRITESAFTGGGVNAFSRYENGKTKPPVALVKLFRVLERHPELLTEIREDDRQHA